MLTDDDVDDDKWNYVTRSDGVFFRLQVVVGQNDLKIRDDEQDVFAVHRSYKHLDFGEGGL